MFEPFGELVECKVIMDRDDPNKSRGFGFVQYRDADNANRALEALNNSQVQGRTIHVQFADRGRQDAGPPQRQSSFTSDSGRYENSNDRYGGDRERERERDNRDSRDDFRDRERGGDRYRDRDPR